MKDYKCLTCKQETHVANDDALLVCPNPECQSTRLRQIFTKSKGKFNGYSYDNGYSKKREGVRND